MLFSSYRDRLDWTLAYAREQWHWHECIGGIALCVRPTRLFLPGDLAVIAFTNGQGMRWDAFGYSSKKRSFINFWAPCQRWHYPSDESKKSVAIDNRTSFRLLTLPDGANPRDPRDPAVLACLAADVPAMLQPGKHG